MLERVLVSVIALFPISEFALGLLRRSRGRSAESRDRGSMPVLVASVTIGFVLAIAAQGIDATRLPGSPAVTQRVALGLLVGGLALRWASIIALGRFFTVDVAIHPGQGVVQHGPYRFMRHPSYTGLLTAFLGVGVFLGNWLSIVGLLVPITVAVLNRVAKEEQALRDALGPAYVAYCARTSRFIPGLL